VLQRAVKSRAVTVWLAATTGITLAQCGVAPEGDSSRQERQAIVNGSVSDVSDSPTLLLQGPEGACSAVLVAPTLAITARHCVATSLAGPFACTAQSELIPNDSNTGSIGTDNSPGSLKFYTWGGYMRGTYATNLPEAVGTRIISTNSTTSCRDDVAFVVLDRVLPDIVPMPMRIDKNTRVGEAITVWGFGLTTGLDPVSLRVVNAQIEAVGPDTPPMTAQPAPVRAVKTGPVTCVGDSGGPFVGADGTMIAIVSLGTQGASNGPFCDTNAQPTVGPRLAAYRALALQALAAVGISTDAGADADSVGEGGATADDDAGMPAADGGTPEEDASMEPDAGEVVPPPPEDQPVDDSGCSIGPHERNGSQHWAFAAVALAVTVAARKRRRRHGSAS
jgi:hypothetical protein